MKHKHFEVITQYYADTSQVVQFSKDNGRTWQECSSQSWWDECNEYQIKPSIPKSGLTDIELRALWVAACGMTEGLRAIADTAIVQAVESGIVKLVEK